MTDQEAARVAQYDQMQAIRRDYAQSCKEMHDHFIRAGFSPNHAFDLLLRQLDQFEGWCDDASD